MKQLKPGTIYHPPNLDCNVRVMKRTNGCEGCILDNPCICPDIVIKNDKGAERPYCAINNIIFVKP